MKKTTTTALFLSLFAATATFAAYEDVTHERYPDAEIVLLDGFYDIAYNPDGTYVSEFTESIKVLTETGRREQSEVSIHYNKRYGKAEILSLCVESPDGSKREIDVAKESSESTDNASERENIYDPMSRKVVCSVPGLKVGDILHQRVRRNVFASRIEGQWAEIYVMEWECPILRTTVRVKSPKELPLKKMAVRNPLGNVETTVTEESDGSVVRTWVATDSPQAFAEPDMPPIHTQIQALRLSTAEDWPQISRWYWNLCLPHLEKVNDAIRAKVAELGTDIPTIYRWVAQEIRYMGLTMEDTSPGYSPHDVDITFGNRYGVCRDKAALLAAMLRLAGHEAYPVLIHAGAKMDPEVPMPYFNHAIVAVYAPGDARANKDGYILMDPTDESSRDLCPAYLGNRSYLVARPEGEKLLTSPVQSAEENSIKITSKGSISRDGAMLLESDIVFLGINDGTYRSALLRRKPDERRKIFENSVRAVAPGAELAGCTISPRDLQDTSKPLTVSLAARIPGATIRGKTRTEISLPLLSRWLGAANWILSGKTSLEKRRFPLVLDSTAMVDETLTVDLGDDAPAPYFLPREEVIEGDYSFKRTCKVEDGKITVKRSLAIGAVEFTPEAYSNLREEIKRVEAADRERPIMETDGNRDANAHYFLKKDDITMTSANDWVVTNEVSMQILTYDGKKKLSEVKYAYNPTWKTVDVVDAVVSNSSGRVSRLDAKEKNVFDCAWAPSAPRYPASKQLIVNLPGVEIGSFVTYKTVTTVKKAPVSFYGKWYFDSVEPADEISLRINDWGRKAVSPAVVKPETMTADGDLWRDCVIISSNDFATAAKLLRKAAAVDAVGPEAAAGLSADAGIADIRNWMAKNVRIAGPSLYEVPLDMQISSPATVLKDRYATRLDYIRTLCALLKGAGFDADIVFAAPDADENAAIKERDIAGKPNVRAFKYAICRIIEKRGGFLGIGTEKVVTYLGLENEYTPVGAVAFDGCTFFDPDDASFGVLAATSPVFKAKTVETTKMYVRENGAVDFEIAVGTFGPAVGDFRKRYAEMLPEDRSRHHQELLGNLAQAASATGELITDVESYPARLSYSAYVPDFATVSGDSISLAVPGFYTQLFPLDGFDRSNPIGIPACSPSTDKFEVTFPEGYTVIDSLPAAYEETDPKTGEVWLTNTVATQTRNGQLTVTLARELAKRPKTMLPKEYFSFLKDYSRVASSRANRTIIVRKAQ